LDGLTGLIAGLAIFSGDLSYFLVSFIKKKNIKGLFKSVGLHG